MTTSVLSSAPRHLAEPARESSASDDAGSQRSSAGVWGFVGRVLAWMVILAAVVVLGVAVFVPRITGSTPYTVLTGSMRPTYPPGTLVVTRPTPAQDIQIGDAITFQLKSGESTVVTHRVIGITKDPEGEPKFITQGDANPAPDADAVRAVQVRGTVWYSVPKLGHLNVWLTGDQRQLAVYAVAALLIGYAGTMFLQAALGRRRLEPSTRPMWPESCPTPDRR